MRYYSHSLHIPDDVIFEILRLIHPYIHLVISKERFCKFLDSNDKLKLQKMPISLLVALNNKFVFEDFHSVLLSYSLRENIALEVASKGNLSTLQWFQSRGITWDRYLLPTLASRGELESLKWAISNQLALIKENGKIATMSLILQRAALNGQINILKWALESKHFDVEHFPIVLESAVSKDQLKIIQWMINNYPSAMKILEKTSYVSICYGAVSGNNIHILEWLKEEFPTTFWTERYNNNNKSSVCVSRAARAGNFDMLKWLKANDFLFNHERITEAAVSTIGNSLEILQYLRSFNCPWSDNVCVEAVKYGRMDILLWAVANGCPWKLEEIMEAAARFKLASANHDILQWINDHWIHFDDIDMDFFIHYAIEYKNFIFVKWAKAIFVPTFWDDRIIKKAAAAGDLPALIWAFEVNPESISSKLVYVLSVNAAKGGHLHVLNWLLAKYDSYKKAIWHPQVCVLAAQYGYVEVLQWAISNGCNWSKYDCCKAAIEYKRLKVLIWMKFQAPSYSHYDSKYWYGDNYLGIFSSSRCYSDGDVLQWLVLNFGNEEGLYFEKRFSIWKKIEV
jgi:hypothetical protein